MTRSGRFGRYADRLARMFDLTVDEAEKLAARIADPTAYTPFLFDGIEMLEVKPGKRYEGAIAVIAKLQPGARFPDNVHRGHETMFVLAGGFRVEGPEGHETWRGDELTSCDGSNVKIENSSRTTPSCPLCETVPSTPMCPARSTDRTTSSSSPGDMLLSRAMPCRACSRMVSSSANDIHS